MCLLNQFDSVTSYIIPCPYNFHRHPDSARISPSIPLLISSVANPHTSVIHLLPLLPRPPFKSSLPSLFLLFPLWYCFYLVPKVQLMTMTSKCKNLCRLSNLTSMKPSGSPYLQAYYLLPLPCNTPILIL